MRVKLTTVNRGTENIKKTTKYREQRRRRLNKTDNEEHVFAKVVSMQKSVHSSLHELLSSNRAPFRLLLILLPSMFNVRVQLREVSQDWCIDRLSTNHELN